MNSSGKFLVPMISFGFDTVFSAPATPPLAEPPKAVMPMRSATPNETANAAFAVRRVCFRYISPPLASLTCLRAYPVTGTLCSRSRPAGGRTLDKREHSRREQGNGRNEHRRRECPGEPVLHLTDEDVTEPTAGTC